MKKVVFISGVSSGFGFEISKLLAAEGHIVYGTIRAKCELPPNVIPLHLELLEPETIRSAIQTVVDEQGRLDVLINNAGMHSGGPIEEIEEEIYRQHFETNIVGWLQVIQNALPHLRKSKSALIINISSIGGLTGLPFQGIHSITKFAIEGLSQALRAELKSFNVKVVVVNPGDFKTNNTQSRIKSINKNSAYSQQFESSMAIVERDEKNGMDPKYMARKVSGIVNRRRPRNRYIIASPLQRFACILKRLLPEVLFRRLIDSHYKC